MGAPYLWSGTLRRSGPDTVEGTVFDPYGFTIAITGTRTADGYALIGTPGPTPEIYSLPGDDLE